MAEPQIIVCESACTVTVQHEIPLFSLGTAEGAQIALAVLTVWAVGFGFRILIRTLNAGDTKESE